MPRARVQPGIELEYERFGDQGEPVLLIMGVGAQMIFWDVRLCEQLAARGLAVIRFDNRDIGHSTWLDHLGVPPVRTNLLRAAVKLPMEAPYKLGDMARDVMGLMDALGMARAHLVGASMGGMIAQTAALHHPHRVASLTSIMSSGSPTRHILRTKPAALRALLAPRARTRAEAVEANVALFRVIGGSMGLDEDRLRHHAGLAWDRGAHPAGFLRQFNAILASGSRLRALRRLRVPTLVIHGVEDPLVPLAAGRAVAEAVPGARFVPVQGMGHDLPSGMWPAMVGAVEELIASAPVAGR